jgi:hypothetical protein
MDNGTKILKEMMPLSYNSSVKIIDIQTKKNSVITNRINRTNSMTSDIIVKMLKLEIQRK